MYSSSAPLQKQYCTNTSRCLLVFIMDTTADVGLFSGSPISEIVLGPWSTTIQCFILVCQNARSSLFPAQICLTSRLYVGIWEE